MKKITIFLFAVTFAVITYAQTDTLLISETTYHMKKSDTLTVDSIVRKYTIPKKQPNDTRPVISINYGTWAGNQSQPSIQRKPVSLIYQLQDALFGKYDENSGCKEGEVFLTNADKTELQTTLQQYRYEGYKTLRVGKVAYDILGNKIPEYVPIFCSEKEYNQKLPILYLQTQTYNH